MTGITKRRSYFYKPEVVLNRELWEEVKNGREIMLFEDVESSDQLDALRSTKYSK